MPSLTIYQISSGWTGSELQVGYWLVTKLKFVTNQTIYSTDENRPLHLHAVEPGNLADSYRRSIRIVPIDCQSKRRDVCTAVQRWRCNIAVAWRKFLLGGWAPMKSFKNDHYVCTSVYIWLQHLQLAFPFLLHSIWLQLYYMAILYTRSNWTNHIHPGGLWWTSHSPLYPNSLDLLCGILSSSTPHYPIIFWYCWQH